MVSTADVQTAKNVIAWALRYVALNEIDNNLNDLENNRLFNGQTSSKFFRTLNYYCIAESETSLSPFFETKVSI